MASLYNWTGLLFEDTVILSTYKPYNPTKSSTSATFIAHFWQLIRVHLWKGLLTLVGGHFGGEGLQILAMVINTFIDPATFKLDHFQGIKPIFIDIVFIYIQLGGIH